MIAEQAGPGNITPQISEINLSDIFLFIKKYTIKIILVSFLFGVGGYGVSFLLPVRYKSSSTLIPETTSSNGMGSLSGLARLSGLTRSESGGAIQPELYPSVLQTIPFSLHLLQQPVVDQDNRSYKTLDFFLQRDETKSEVENKPKVIPKMSEEIIALSKSENANSLQALTLVDCQYDSKTGIITITSETPDPYVSAQLVNVASRYLIQYVTDYRTQKTVREVEFLGKRVTEAKKREYSAEFALQSYRDRNRSAFSNVAQIEEQRLQAEYILAQSLYNDIVRKWEDAKIRVKEEQPVIKVLSPPQIPLKRSKPQRLMIALPCLILGMFASSIYLLLADRKLKETILVE